ncbi:MAG: hypothetical protein HMLKMBBP_00381 [Planctomycetes bacterium]|nr:hypothetical protein [Planctomycetota bacterium]
MADGPAPDEPQEGASALVVVVPEAEAAVGAVRAARDPSAAAGMPAHVTVLFPFVPESAWDAAAEARTALVVSRFAAFDARFRGTARFPGTAWLKPSPAAAFRDLTNALSGAFPAYPPFGGAHAEVVPHLTVAHGSDADLAAAEAAVASTDVEARVSRVTRFVLRGGRWTQDSAFPLATDARPAASEDPRTAGLSSLCTVMERLRARDGCPWDREQTLATLWPYLREELDEAAHAAAAAERGDGDPDEVREELGDLLFNVIFAAETARERGWFSIADVIAGAEAKIRRRHPHIFGGLSARSPEEVERIWAAVKAEERAEKERRRARKAAAGRPNA